MRHHDPTTPRHKLVPTQPAARLLSALPAFATGALRRQCHVLEAPAPLGGCRSTLSVGPDRAGSTATWRSSVEAMPGTAEAEVRPLMAGIDRQGPDHLPGSFE